MFQSTFNTLLGSVAGLRALTNLGKEKKEKPEEEDLYDEAPYPGEESDEAPAPAQPTPDQQAIMSAFSNLVADAMKQNEQKKAIKQRRDMLYQEADEGPDLGAALREKMKGGN